ncbi:hypothetical protein [uncultured Oxalicibacterium sp.]|uniref:hypothetical protein n=1 Tax=uncultured Oxalicibacterium sp. TaxID=1168540 RepID=UPI0025D2F8DD|nr:hypothetical protein [uncultured Oxalicibacterium sp.]
MKYLDLEQRLLHFRLSSGFKNSAISGAKLAGATVANAAIFAGKATATVVKHMPDAHERLKQEQERRKK